MTQCYDRVMYEIEQKTSHELCILERMIRNVNALEHLDSEVVVCILNEQD